MQINHSHIVLDACCFLNFYASGCFIEILESIPAQVVVTEVVRDRELITLEHLISETKSTDENLLSLAIKKGLILLTDFESEKEELSFLDYASVLGDDGESASLAIAANRGWGIATDDKKAVSFAQKEAPDVQILSTLDVIKHWSEGAELMTPSAVLRAIRVKGRYIPHRNHPLFDWWKVFMD